MIRSAVALVDEYKSAGHETADAPGTLQMGSRVSLVLQMGSVGANTEVRKLQFGETQRVVTMPIHKNVGQADVASEGDQQIKASNIVGVQQQQRPIYTDQQMFQMQQQQHQM